MQRSWDAPQFTCDYSQPDSYRFSLDSILLAKAVVRDWQKGPEKPKILDLCAGCGVIGLELSHLHPVFRHLDFVEVQSSYFSHFQENLGRSPHLQVSEINWYNQNYADLVAPHWSALYDLVVCNPPYFEIQQGRLPPDELKARSRFFIDSDFTTLWTAILNVLKPQGEAYVLVREQKDHGGNRNDLIESLIEKKAKVLSTEDLRGTWLYRIQKITSSAAVE